MSKPVLTLPCKYTLSDFEKRGDRHHCASCNHSLKDFRNATDEEIREAISTADVKTCGIFYPSQLGSKPLRSTWDSSAGWGFPYWAYLDLWGRPC
jgi:hypothetical protein